ncbi:prephenate dehydratase domain-containing protein [Enterobacteriaceae endosymbiont of Donacia sparganii]|uniref:prephenate dehydratase domain-containing protein n=1 Tax=Enterobacteriaceae endosymbiont of Donacia sparganii TaxID=2675785 RepID=UPI00144915B9|nr:prephenate dehydratase domain-containing protein [Enterobacteriaceae endosymbiont of Donacia sparganii]QJC35915.1 hypothetical protein GJT98_02260 [Enterobacteriaceae endosymbiont of Donacia sparganii]
MLKIIKTNIFYYNTNLIINKNIRDFIKKKKSKTIIDNSYHKSIAFLGPLGSYSHLALLTYINKCFFRKILINISCKNFAEIFFHIKNNNTHLAIVPIYNNYTGLIKEVSILLEKNNSFLYIKKNFKLPIKHCLVTSKTSLSLNKIERIFSHPEIFKQCSFFIKKFPHWEIKYCSSSSYAMNLIKKNSSEKLAAIGNKITANFYNLYILKNEISNFKDNTTNFLVLKKKFN